MSQQKLDLRRSFKIVRRHRMLFGGLVALGLLGGAAYAVVKPPVFSGTALVVLPQAAAQSEQTGVPGIDNIIATQMVIATSNPVLSDALPHISPATTLESLKHQVQVTSLAGSILSITASGSTAGQAEDVANAVASSYVSYVGSANSPVGRTSANVLERATTATGSKLPEQIAIFGALGIVAGALIGFVLALVIGRKDRRLVEREAIANSIAAPVLASIPVSHPSDAAAWAKLLDEYEPEAVHAWGLSQFLQHLGVGAHRSGGNGRGGSSSVTVLSLSSDPEALALGPQLAAFAATQGIPTALVIGPQQDVNGTATLRTACSAPEPSAPRRPSLRLVVADGNRVSDLRSTFTVVVAVVDGREPHVPDTIRTRATVLGVSAGGATAEELARASTAAAADGREVIGILVANPEENDSTTGRVPRLAMPLRRPLPTRLNGATMEIRR